MINNFGMARRAENYVFFEKDSALLEPERLKKIKAFLLLFIIYRGEFDESKRVDAKSYSPDSGLFKPGSR